MTDSLTTWTPTYDRRTTPTRALPAATASGVAIAAARTGFAPVLRSAEPFPSEFDTFLTRKLAAAPPGGSTTSLPSLVSLSALLTGGEPWPTDLALLLVRRVAVLLDTADEVGVMIGTFTPACVALYGPHVVLAHHDDRAGLDPAYIAPEQLQSGRLVDARATQYGLALVAATLLASAHREHSVLTAWRARVLGGLHAGRGRSVADTPDPRLGPAVRQVLRTARDANPERRFPSARDFATALERAYAEWCNSGRAVIAGPGARWPARYTAAYSAAALALSFGAAAWWYAARTPAAVPPELRNDSAGARVIAALASPSAAAPALASTVGSASAASASALLDSALLADLADQRAGGPPWDATPGLLGVRHATRLDTSGHSALSTSALELRIGTLAMPVVLPGADATARSDLRRRLADSVEPVKPWVGTKPTMAPGSDGPHYPTPLLNQRIQGEVVARFAIDSTGRVDPHTVEFIRSSHASFTTAVRESLRRLRYAPPERDGHHVGQTVEQTFRFVPPH